MQLGITCFIFSSRYKFAATKGITMKFIKIVNYVEDSYEGKPSFVLLMSDNKEYISNGCVFVENTDANIKELIEEFDCKSMLEELFNSPSIDISSVTDSRSMFEGCTSLVEFSSDLSSVTNSSYMFCGCTSLVEFSGDLSAVTDSNHMFYGCTSLPQSTKDKYL